MFEDQDRRVNFFILERKLIRALNYLKLHRNIQQINTIESRTKK
jgi:hypothetical protein